MLRTFASQKFHIMAYQNIDIERMIMQARYKMQLEAEAPSVKGGQLSDMEREEYQKQINDLLQAVETLLNSNKVMGERVAHLERVAEAYEDLKAENAKLKGELAMRKRGQYGKKNEKSTQIPLTRHNDFKGCVFVVKNTKKNARLFNYSKKDYLIKMSGMGVEVNERNELAKKALPNVRIKNLTVNLTGGADYLYVFNTNSDGKKSEWVRLYLRHRDRRTGCSAR